MSNSASNTVVLIPHYNHPEGLIRSLQSLAQSTLDIDIVIVDDGSSQSPDIDQLRKAAPNVTLLRLERNQGIENALNHGLAHILADSRYRYIARLDAEDTVTPDRFEKQLRFLENNPDHYIVGSYVRFCSPSGNLLWEYKPPTNPNRIQKSMFINNMFCHPAVMCRRELFEEFGAYPRNYPSAEDYALFFEVTRTRLTANLPEFLTYSIVNPAGITIQQRKNQLRSRLRIIVHHFDCTPVACCGLARNLLLCIVPYKLVRRLKSILSGSISK